MRFLDRSFSRLRRLRGVLVSASAALGLMLLAGPVSASNQVVIDFDYSGVLITLENEAGEVLKTQRLKRRGIFARKCSTESVGANILSITGSEGGEEKAVCVYPFFHAIGVADSPTAGQVGKGQTLSLAAGNEDQEFYSAKLNLRVQRRNALIEVQVASGASSKTIEVRVGRFQSDPPNGNEIVLCQRYRNCMVEVSGVEGDRIDSISLTPTKGSRRLGIFSLGKGSLDVPSFEPESPILDLACGDNDFEVTTEDGARLTITRQNQAEDNGCAEVDELPLDLGIIEELIDGESVQTQFFQTDNLGTNPAFFLDVLWRAEIVSFVDQAAVLVDSTLPTNTSQLQISVQGHKVITLGEALLRVPQELFLVDQCPVGAVQFSNGTPIGFNPSAQGVEDMFLATPTLDFGCFYEQQIERVDDAVCETQYGVVLSESEGCAVVRQGVAVIGDWFTSRNLR